MNRKHWIDNLRWVTVLLVLLYHVIYFYNNKGVFGGVGGFGDGPQYQDVLMYILYPWFMPLLFLLAGIGSRYALERKNAKEWFKARTLKLLVPATIGLFVFQWMTGYFNTHVAVVSATEVEPTPTTTDVMAAVPQPVKYFLWCVSGIGPLWFIQDLWLFSLLLLLIRKITCCATSGKSCKSSACASTAERNHLQDQQDLYRGAVRSYWIVGALVLLGVLFWLGQQTLIFNPRPESADGLWNLYKPVLYFITFLLGYFVFSKEEVQDALGKAWIPLMTAALISGTVLTVTTFGQNNTIPQYMSTPLNCLYGWLMCLAMMAWFKAKFDKTNAFAAYMTRSSFGLYIVHYLVIASLGYMMKVYTQLPPVAMYLILTVAVFTLSPLLYELIRRIPFIRWGVLGIVKKRD